LSSDWILVLSASLYERAKILLDLINFKNIFILEYNIIAISALHC